MTRHNKFLDTAEQIANSILVKVFIGPSRVAIGLENLWKKFLQ